MTRVKTLPEHRFWSKVRITDDGCWLWTAATAGNGYGVIGETRDKMVYAHRLSWIMAYGPIPDGLFVLHRCDNPPCVRPGHLFLGSHADNMRDRVAKGRYPSERPAQRGTANGSSKLTETAVRLIRGSDAPGRLIARHLGVSPTLIRLIRQRKAWAWVA